MGWGWLYLIFAAIGFALVAIGVRATHAPGQPADVRMGGLIPICAGVVILAIEGIVFFIHLCIAAFT